MAKERCSDCRFYRAKSTGMKDAHGDCVVLPYAVAITAPDTHFCGEFVEAERRAAMVHEAAQPISPVVYEGARPLPQPRAYVLVRVPLEHEGAVRQLLEGLENFRNDPRMAAT